MPGRTRHAIHVAIRVAQLVAGSAVAAGVLLSQSWRLRGEGRSGFLRAFARAQVALCHRLGATFIKVGQIASTRGDLLPREWVEELATLRDQVPPFSFEDARRVIESSLGRPLESIYAGFERAPVAAASVIARAEFVREMVQLSRKFGLKLQKGAGPLVKQQANEIIQKFGVLALKEVAKLHFRTAYEVVSAAEYRVAARG